MNAQEWEKLRNNWNELLRLHPSAICRDLFQTGTINDLEKNGITDKGPKSKQMENLLFLLKEKSPALKPYSALILAIKKDSDWLADKIVKTDVKSDLSLRANINPDSLDDRAREVLRKYFVNTRGETILLKNLQDVLKREHVFKYGSEWDDKKMNSFLMEEFVEVSIKTNQCGITWIINIGWHKGLRSKYTKEVKPIMKDNQPRDADRAFKDGLTESSHRNGTITSKTNRSIAGSASDKIVITSDSSTVVKSTDTSSQDKKHSVKRRLSTKSTAPKSNRSCERKQGQTSQLHTAVDSPMRHEAVKQGQDKRQTPWSQRCVTNSSKIKRQRSDPTFSRKVQVLRQVSSPNFLASSSSICRREQQRRTNSLTTKCPRRAAPKMNLLSFRSQVKPSDQYKRGCIVNNLVNVRSKKLIPFRNFHLIDNVGNIDDSIDGSQRMMEELIKFISACLNDRQNGTIYFGISPSKCRKYELGEIVGVNGVKTQPILEKCVELSFSAKQRGIVLSTIVQHRMVPVVNEDHLNLFVIEVDIVPSCSLVNEEFFLTKLSAISYNFKRNNKCLIAFSEQGVPKVVHKQHTKNYKRRHINIINQRLKEETLNKALTSQSPNGLKIPKSVIIMLLIIILVSINVMFFASLDLWII